MSKDPIGEIVHIYLGPANDDGPWPGLTMTERDDGARDVAVFVPKFSMPLFKHRVAKGRMSNNVFPFWMPRE